LDNIIAKIVGLKPTVSQYVQTAREFVATKTGKAVVTAVVLLAIVAYAHHRGAVSTEERLTPKIEELQTKLSEVECPTVTVREPIDDTESKRRASELADRLSESEAAKARLQKKVSDYEKQLAKRPAKAGAFTLSPADAGSLSNIK
jgi:hypothetical protein